jgi:hypothetical protein
MPGRTATSTATTRATPRAASCPFRLAVEGLSKGSHTIRIQYDFTAGGHKAYDFLARYNGWVSPPMCGSGGGGVSSMCPSLPSPSSFAFPSDPFKTDGLTVAGAQAYSAVVRRLTIWGGTITSIAGPSHAGSTAGNSTAEFTVKFTSTGSAVLLAWGGHLAQSRYWQMSIGGPRDGAGEVSGAPWHMRTLQLDGSGNRNQDRSIQPSAIVGELPPLALAPPTPTPRPTPRPPAPQPPTPHPIVPAIGATPGPGDPVPTAPATSIAEPDRAADGFVPGDAAALMAGRGVRGDGRRLRATTAAGRTRYPGSPPPLKVALTPSSGWSTGPAARDHPRISTWRDRAGGCPAGHRHDRRTHDRATSSP